MAISSWKLYLERLRGGEVPTPPRHRYYIGYVHLLYIAITFNHVIAVWSMTHTGYGNEFVNIIFRAVTWGRGYPLPHVIAIYRLRTLTLNRDGFWSRDRLWSMTNTGCGYEYVTILFKAVTWGGTPHVIAIYRLRTLTLNSDNFWSRDRRVIDDSYRVWLKSNLK